MKRNLAQHYFVCNRLKQSIIYTEEAIRRARKHKFKNYEMYFTCELAIMYYYQKDYKMGIKIFQSINIDQVEDNDFIDVVRFKYFYGFGVILNVTKRHEEAKLYFEKAIEYSYSNMTKGGAISGIGISYLRSYKYLDAIITFKKALEVQDDRNRRGIAHTNLAVTYRTINKYNDALKYIKKALELIDKNIEDHYFFAYEEYVRIKAIRDKSYESVIEFLKFIKENEDKYASKDSIIEAIEKLGKIQ